MSQRDITGTEYYEKDFYAIMRKYCDHKRFFSKQQC